MSRVKYKRWGPDDKRKHFRVSESVLEFDKGFISSQMECSTNGRNREALLKALRMAIEEDLTDVQRKYALLYYFDNMTEGQIAELYKVNQSTVCRTLRRARKRLYCSLRFCIFFINSFNEDD